CATAIEQTTHQKTQIATSLAKAVACLQANDYDALVLDESFNHADIGGVNLLLNHAGLPCRFTSTWPCTAWSG
ncbi:MAG TPA: hypothetical protein VIH91_08040, partial [Terriglobales bacterium]